MYQMGGTETGFRTGKGEMSRGKGNYPVISIGGLESEDLMMIPFDDRYGYKFDLVFATCHGKNIGECATEGGGSAFGDACPIRFMQV
jgi:hypothetical protein